MCKMSENRGGINYNFIFSILVAIIPISILLKNTLISSSLFESFPLRQLIELLPYLFLLSIGYYLFRKIIIKIRRPSLPLTHKVQFTTVIVVFLPCVIFFNQLEILQELIFFSTHKDAFAELVDVGEQSECYRSESSCIEYVVLSDTLESQSGRERIFTLSSLQNQRVIATRSRANIYYVYVPETTSVPEGEKIYQHNIQCFYQLENGWHLCHI